MKRTSGLLICMAVCLWAWPGAAQTQKPPGTQPARQPAQKPQKKAAMQTFLGVISDGQCGASHTAVMKKASVNSVANCVKGCAHRHGFVLYDPAAKKIYKL